ncbi:MAG TPA: hypothetical protein VGR35_10265 [Tepidisphaeraceae bacterium]|nr:hypothetical protein [Tepidisphaeraceae bacterium]
MPDKWMTVAAAAATLDVHPRTIERRIASNKIESRRTDDGQLQVMIDVPEPADPAPDPLETVRELAHDQVSLATGSASALVRFAQDDAQRARTELSVARQEAHSARRATRVAWTAVAAMTLAICGAVGWVSHKVTKSEADIRALTERARTMESEAQQLLVERNQAQTLAQAAEVDRAEAAGRLAAYVEQNEKQAELLAEQSDKRPATQPTTLIQRIASAIAGE